MGGRGCEPAGAEASTENGSATAIAHTRACWIGRTAAPVLTRPCRTCQRADAVSYARIGMINFPRHVDFGAGVATTLAICAITVHRIVSTEDPRAVDDISLSV